MQKKVLYSSCTFLIVDCYVFVSVQGWKWLVVGATGCAPDWRSTGCRTVQGVGGNAAPPRLWAGRWADRGVWWGGCLPEETEDNLCQCMCLTPSTVICVCSIPWWLRVKVIDQKQIKMEDIRIFTTRKNGSKHQAILKRLVYFMWFISPPTLVTWMQFLNLSDSNIYRTPWGWHLALISPIRTSSAT